MKKIILVVALLFIFCVVGVGLLYLKFSHSAFNDVMSSSNITKDFEIKEGDGSKLIGVKLEDEELIEDRNQFYFYIWKTKTANALQAGEYELAPNMTIGQMVEKFRDGDVVMKILKLTIPEGFTNKKTVVALREKKPSIADEFERIVNCKCLGQTDCTCDVFSKKYNILRDFPSGVDMEGYLFPDTYFIDEEETGATLVSKFLNNFNKKVDDDLKRAIKSQGKSLHEIITMASIIEREARIDRDRKIVSGIFWDRISDEFPLQSCATLAYFLGTDKMQFSHEDTKIDSPYNTYLNSGLPPGPISNPGIASIKASVYPEVSNFYYFLSNPKTGEIFYSATLEEHNQRKLKNGL